MVRLCALYRVFDHSRSIAGGSRLCTVRKPQNLGRRFCLFVIDGQRQQLVPGAQIFSISNNGTLFKQAYPKCWGKFTTCNKACYSAADVPSIRFRLKDIPSWQHAVALWCMKCISIWLFTLIASLVVKRLHLL